MDKFLIKTISGSDLEKEIINIGYDKSYAFKGKEKFCCLNFKIFGITSVQGNIIKQIALSVGADCATHRDVITGKIEKSDCILGGNISQLRVISQKLQLQPFGLKELGSLIEGQINNASSQTRTKIVGILNLTKNSFSDGGMYYEFEDAVNHLNELINDGADIIDIGAESTKPYSEPVSAELQIERLIFTESIIPMNMANRPIQIQE